MPRQCSDTLDVTKQIADHLDLVGLVIGDFHPDELILDCDHQFNTVEPVGSEIIGEVRFIRDPFEVDAQMRSNESTDLAGGKTFFQASRLLN